MSLVVSFMKRLLCGSYILCCLNFAYSSEENPLALIASKKSLGSPCEGLIEARDLSWAFRKIAAYVNKSGKAMLGPGKLPFWLTILSKRLNKSNNKFDQLYRHALEFSHKPSAVYKWLQKNLYHINAQADLGRSTEHNVNESWASLPGAGGGVTSITKSSSMNVALYSETDNINQTIANDSLVVIAIKQAKDEHGEVLGQNYGGQMRTEFLLLSTGAQLKNIFSVLAGLNSDLDNFYEITNPMVRDGTVKVVLGSSIGREVFRYGERAASISFLDRDILQWRETAAPNTPPRALTGRANFESNGAPAMGAGLAWQYQTNLMYIASAFTLALYNTLSTK